MKRSFFIALFAVSLLAAPAREQLAFDESNSSIAFVASKVIFGEQSGEFTRFRGAIGFVEGQSNASSVTVDIEMDSVDADSSGLTRHLKTGDFFDVKRYPHAIFSSTAIVPMSDGRHRVTGILELHGVKKSISFPAQIRHDAGAVSVDAEFPLNRKDFGIEYDGAADNVIKDNVVIRLHVRAPRAKK